MYQNYIFDLYGTLVDIHTNEQKPYLWKKVALYMQLQGANYTPSELKAAYENAIPSLRLKRQEDFPDAPLSELEVDFATLVPALYEKKELAVTPQQVADWAILFRSLSLQRLRLFDGAKETLLSLRQQGKKVFLLSNAQRLFTEPELRALGIYDLFDDVLISSDIGYKKPSPRFYQALLEKHQLDPNCSVMVGNDDKADAWGACQVGLDSYYIQTEQSPILCDPLPENCRRISKISAILKG